jgi:ABC-type polysaccharide/polyol phosphate export permease
MMRSSRKHLALLGQLTTVQHRLLDQSTGLGYLWSFLNPLLMLLVLWAFFSQQVGMTIPMYPVYLLVGLVQFTHFSKSAGAAMRALGRMRSLATSVIFPKDILVYSALLANLPEFLISMVLTALVALLSGAPLSWAWLALPLVLLMQLLLVLWVSVLLSMIYVFVRDIEHLFDVGMRILFFGTPVIYSLDALSPALRSAASLNPLAQVIGYSRMILLDGQWPPVIHLLAFLCINGLAAVAAIACFRRAQPALLERL